jgi:hypothetical protein
LLGWNLPHFFLFLLSLQVWKEEIILSLHFLLWALHLIQNHTQGGCFYLQIWSLNLIFFVEEWKDDHNRLVCSGFFFLNFLLWVQFLMLACCCWLLLCHCQEETQNISCEYSKFLRLFQLWVTSPCLPSF